jgi:hypothetical protein
MNIPSKAIVILVFAVALVSTLLLASSAEASATLCCFNNWRFSGTCIAQIGQDQRCGDVLGILNNPMSTTTTYCGGTQVRGGWTTVNCGGGGSSEGSQSTGGGTITQPEYVKPVEPSYTGTAAQPQYVTPEKTSPSGGAVQPVQPSFVAPVQPTTAPEAQGPSVLSL